MKKYVGCYDADTVSQYFVGAHFQSHHMTNKFCASFCYTEGYKYSATQNGCKINLNFKMTNLFNLYKIFEELNVCVEITFHQV